jgi:hypothetical protein
MAGHAPHLGGGGFGDGSFPGLKVRRQEREKPRDAKRRQRGDTHSHPTVPDQPAQSNEHGHNLTIGWLIASDPR